MKILLGLAVGMACQAALPQALEEIVVTARRQGEEKLMETPLAITAFDANAIEARGIASLQDVAELTPGLTFYNPFGENLPTPIIRGIVPQDIFSDNAAAIFVDGVYVAGREGLNFSQLDIERIEVLKGPQSSTYGRNAFSGAINYVTKAPSDVFEAKVDGSVGNRGKQKMMGQVSGPIWGDALTGRVSVLYDEWDGSYDNTLAPENDVGGYRYRSYQGKLRWRPTDTLDINLGLYRSNDEIDESATGAILANCENQVLQTAEDVAGATAGGVPTERLLNWCGRIPKLRQLPGMLDPATFPNPTLLPGSIGRDKLPKNALAVGEDRDLVRGNLTINWDTDYGALSSLTGYSHLKQNSVSDFARSSGDTVPLAYCYPALIANPPGCEPPFTWSRMPMGFVDIEDGSTVEEWSQELRFTGPRDQRLRWQVGGYYFHSTQDNHQGNPVGTRALPDGLVLGPDGNLALGPVALPSSLAIGTYIFGEGLTPTAGFDPLSRVRSDQSQKSWSVFAATDFDITDQLEARAELRYTQDYKHSNSYTYLQCTDPADPDAMYPLYHPDPACGDPYWDLRDLAPTGIASGSSRFDYTTGRIGLNYKMDSGWMVYASIAYGEKPGGSGVSSGVDVITDSGIAKVPLVEKFSPEKMTAYELGLKGYTPDRRIRIDMSVFYNDWRDIVLKQLTDKDPASGLLFTMPRTMNVNAGDAHVYGWEINTDVGMTDNLTARFTAGYTESRLKKARQDSFGLFPSFYTTDPECAPAAIQALPVADQELAAASCKAKGGDISGHDQMRQPRWTASLSFDYRHQLVGDWDLKSSLSGTYTDKIYGGNDNQNWVPPHTNVNFSIGAESPRYTVQLWVRNLLNNDKPLAVFRDIYWTNDADMLALMPTTGTTIHQASNFRDFPPMRMTISYPSLRTWGLTATMRFGGAEK